MSFFRHTSVVGGLTLLSRITGLVRDMALARLFPTASGVMDAFLVAYQIPNFLRRLFAEGAFSQAFVPVVAEYRARRSTGDVRELVEGVAGTWGLVLAVLSLLGVLAAPVLVWMFAPGFRQDGVRFDLTVEMLRWTFPYLLFVSLTALAAGVLNSYQKFALPALASVVLNVVLIVFAAWIAPQFAQPGVVLAMGVLVGGLLQTAMQLPALIRLGVLRVPRLRWRHEGVRRIARLMGPAILGSSMGQLSVMLSSIIASFLATGSIAWLYFADRLVEFPLGIFSIALATVILPSLSGDHANESRERFSATLEWALRLVCVIVIPACVALFVLAGPMTVVFFHDREFTAQDVEMTRLALMAFSFALFGWSMVKVLAPGFYARQNTRAPVRIAMQSLGLNMGLNVVLIAVLAILGMLDTRGMHALLALTNGIGALFNCALLYLSLRREGVLMHAPGWRALLLRIALATVAMALLLYWIAGSLHDWLTADTLHRVLWLTVCVAGGGGLYFAVLWLAGARYRDFRPQLPASRTVER